MIQLNSNQITTVRNDRRALEVDVAKKLNELLETYYKPDIKRLMMQILKQIQETAETMGPAKMNSVLRRQTAYMMWKQCRANPNLAGLRKVSHHLNSNGPKWLYVCSDLIRLFGELSEAHEIVSEPWGSPSQHRKWTQFGIAKDKLRPQPVYATPAKYQKKGPQVMERRADGWGHRDRFNEADPVTVDQPFVDIPRERVNLRGVEKFGFGVDSVIETIDYTFGLQIEGGDVSGTTTDSMAVIRWSAAESGTANVHTVTQLIAIATMVPQGHHTIVECAWPLTRHKYMDYKIGFYDTLVSKKDHEPIHKELARFNDDQRNKHILVCWDGKADMGLQLDQPTEIDEYRKFAGVRQAYSFCVGGRPRPETIANMLAAHSVTI